MDASFEKRIYTAEEYFAEMPGTNERIELIEGEIVYQGAPSVLHQTLVLETAVALRSHIKSKNGRCKVFPAPLDVKLDDHNVIQPDVFVVCDEKKLDGKRCNGAPDLAIEIVSGTGRNDYAKKLALYHDFGVREYWIIDPGYEKTLVYFWDETEFPEIYPFDKPIPVRIWGGGFSITISELTV